MQTHDADRAHRHAYYLAHKVQKAAAGHAYYVTHKEASHASSLRYQAAHPGAAVARVHAWEAAHPDQRKADQAAYRARHRVEINAKARANRATNRAKATAREARYRAAHPEVRAKERLWAKEYTATHPEIIRAQSRLRRARKAKVVTTLTKEQWQTILVAYNHKCAYCGKKLKRLTMDHVIPISKGGAHSCDNVVPACRHCNSSKGARPPKTLPAKRLMF